jgi:hypothetical protein
MHARTHAHTIHKFVSTYRTKIHKTEQCFYMAYSSKYNMAEHLVRTVYYFVV